MSVATETRLDAAIEAATTRLLELQHPDGYWVGELESNVTMTAQHLFWHHVLGLRTPELDRKIANELLARQRDDGTWAIWFDGPGDLSTTVEAYAALKLAGVDPGPQARDFIRSRGGIAKTRIFTKCFLALLGQWPWQRVTPIPVELVLFPPSAPFSIYNFSCWARGTFVPLAACRALRPVRARRDRPARDRRPARQDPLARAARADAPRGAARGRALGARPPGGGRLVGRHPAAVGLVDPDARRARPRLRGRDAAPGGRGLGGLHDRRRRPPAARGVPVAGLGHGPRRAGAAGRRPRPRASRARPARPTGSCSEEVTVAGDWAVRTPELAPGGWAFEFQNDLYPDVDDTAVVALALRRCHRGHDAVDRGLAWTAGMQSRSGGWGAFDVDNEAYWLYKLPFCDFGKVTDEPSADVSAHALEALAPEAGFDDEVRRGLDWLLREQEADGSWFGRWGVNHVYGTGAALPALEACGIEPGHRAFRRAVAWLDSVQNEDGGFGEDIRSYADRAWRGRGASTPSQTAWALLAYVAADEADSHAARRAAEWLCSTQLANGDWDEAQFTGTGFPLDFMIRYHLYRLHFPLLALGRLRERLAR